jgi:uncharacterized protein
MMASKRWAALSKTSLMWNLYDHLISAVPETAEVVDCLAGLNWFLVRSLGVGVAMRPLETAGALRDAGHLGGMKLRDLAMWVKSWNEYEAAMGLAAINAALNAPQIVRETCAGRLNESQNQDIFTCMREHMRGKRVAVIGHFIGLERVAEICDLSILERRPQPGDLPDSACEYVLPDQDIVIMTATALINKTMPRLLALSQGAHIIVAGPTTPLHPLMFDYGIEVLGGLLVEDQTQVWRVVAEGGQKEIFSAGSRMVTVQRTP